MSEVQKNKRYSFEKINILNPLKIRLILNKFKPDIILHLAAETHVDRSIDSPIEFLNSNVM